MGGKIDVAGDISTVVRVQFPPVHFYFLSLISL